ncbi:MFS general substrate transporter [Atractiella rhizophila]|nr:MFS general substrate transporter [Atractiella rhizophila]
MSDKPIAPIRDCQNEVDLEILEINSRLDTKQDQDLKDASGLKEDSPSASNVVLTTQTNFLPAQQAVVVFIALALCLALVYLDQVIIGPALPTVAAYFNGGRQSVWVVTAYLVTSTAFQPSFGRLSDIFGRKLVLLIGVIEFLLASLACALSQSMTQLIVFRAFQGIGGGNIMTLTYIIASDIVDLKNRGKYQGIFECVAAISNGLGPLLGGVFSEQVSWRWCFWINLPISGVALTLITLCLPLKKVEGDLYSKLKSIDYVGSAFTLTGSILLLIALNWGGVEYEWVSAPVLVLIFVSLATFFAFWFWEWKVARLPIVPMYIFRFRTVSGVCLVTLCLGMVYYNSIIFVPQLLIIAKGYSPVRAGVLMIPFVLGVTVMVLICGQITALTGVWRAMIITGFVIWSVACGLLATIEENTKDSKVMGFLFLAAVGPGCIFFTSLTGLQASVDRKDMAVVTSVRSFLRFLGGTLGLAISSALINNVIRQEAQSIDLPDEVLQIVLDDPTAIRSSLSRILSPEDQKVLIHAYALGFRTVFLVCAGLCTLGFIVSATLIQHHELERGDEKELRQEAKLRLKTLTAAPGSHKAT